MSEINFREHVITEYNIICHAMGCHNFVVDTDEDEVQRMAEEESYSVIGQATYCSEHTAEAKAKLKEKGE